MQILIFQQKKKNLSTNIQNTNFDNIDYNSNYSNYNEDTNYNNQLFPDNDLNDTSNNNITE